MAHNYVSGDRHRPEVPGIAEFEGDDLVLRCWPDKHWIGDLKAGVVLRLWDRRCKKYVLFSLEDVMNKLARAKRPAA